MLKWRQRLSFVVFLLAGIPAAYAFAVYGAINDKYNVLGRENGPLGSPKSDEAPAPHGGRFNAFSHGFIFWHPEIGAFGVWGAIGEKWNAVGQVSYGYPITDELTTPDRRGRFNHFKAVHLAGKPMSSIYWTPQTDAHIVYGAIREKWQSEGWERGRLGYPTSDEVADGPYRRNTFEGGFIRWTSAGAEVIPTGLAPPEGGGFHGVLVKGLMARAELPARGNATLYRDSAIFSHSELCARFLNQAGLNDRLRDVLVSRLRSRLPSGFGIHSQTNHRTGSSCSARAELFSQNVSIVIRVPNNRFFVRITTPSGIPGGLDPNFVVTYDLVLRTSYSFPGTVAGNVVQGPVTVIGLNVSRPQSNSVTGQLVIAASDLLTFLGQPGFFAALRQGGVAEVPAVNGGVAELNARLQEVKNFAPGTRLDILPEGDLVLAVATNRPLPPGPN